MAALTLFPLQYKRQDAVPVDIDITFSSTAERNSYLTNARRYAGMLVVDTEEDKAYLLNSTRDAWIAVGSASLTVKDEGVALGSEPTTSIDFVGDNVEATSGDNGVNVTVALTDGVFMFQVGLPVPLGGDHLHWALMTTAQAKDLIHGTDPTLSVGNVAQPSLVLTTEYAGVIPGHTHDITVVFDYNKHTFVVTNITNNLSDNHAANIIGSPGVLIQNEGTGLGAAPLEVLNFVGSDVLATTSDDGKTVVVTVSSPTIIAKDEGSSLGGTSLTSIDFVGAGVTASSVDNGASVVVTIPGGGGGGGNVYVQDEGVSLGGSALTTLNFVGGAVTATSVDSGSTVTVTVASSATPTVYEYNQSAVTMSPTHLGNIVRMGFASTQTYTVTETVGSECPVGTSLVITWSGIGLVTIVQGSNSVILTPETLNIRKRYGQVTLTKMVAPNIWQIEGNLQSS